MTLAVYARSELIGLFLENICKEDGLEVEYVLHEADSLRNLPAVEILLLYIDEQDIGLPEALAALPADIPYSDLLVYTEPEDIGFCYHYRRDGKIYPLTNADGYPVCVQ